MGKHLLHDKVVSGEGVASWESGLIRGGPLYRKNLLCFCCAGCATNMKNSLLDTRVIA